MRHSLTNIALLLGSLILFFGGVEGTLRVTGLQRTKPSPPPIYQASPNPRISYELKPNMRERAFNSTITTNSIGLRSPEVHPEKPLIAVVGDSIVFGYGVENDETLSARLEALLPHNQFLNVGVPGYNLEQETALYEKKIAPLDPKGVILVFYFNDLLFQETPILDETGILRPPSWEPAARRCNPIEEGILGFIPGRCWLDEHSAFYKFVKKIIVWRQGQRDLSMQREDALAEDAEDPVTPEQLALYAEQLERFSTLIPEAPARVFVIWPDKLLHRESRPQLRRIAEAEEFLVIDLYDRFGNAAETLWNDTEHPSARTIEEAARFIVDSLNIFLK